VTIFTSLTCSLTTSVLPACDGREEASPARWELPSPYHTQPLTLGTCGWTMTVSRRCTLRGSPATTCQPGTALCAACTTH